MINSPKKITQSMLEEISRINLAELKKAIEQALPSSSKTPRVLLISPVIDDYLSIRKFFPQFNIFIVGIKDWDLNNVPNLKIGIFDIAITSNVMMYSPDPQNWINNISAIAKTIVIQDLIYRKRSANSPHLGFDTDKIRFFHSQKNIPAKFPDAFDLNTIKQSSIYFNSFIGGPNEFHSEEDLPIHFALTCKSDTKIENVSTQASISRIIKIKTRNVFFSNKILNRIYRVAIKII